ncbi:hypothetical protein D7I39_00630 [Allopusillimonas ginsengisoli]|nr:hypothetical protein D7I39_00630 [Allopusillimonas ginsengisoli]
MKNFSQLFTKHPSSVGESYLQHMKVSFSFALTMLGSGVAAIVHGVLPFCFVKTGSTNITNLYKRMVAHRDSRVG